MGEIHTGILSANSDRSNDFVESKDRKSEQRNENSVVHFVRDDDERERERKDREGVSGRPRLVCNIDKLKAARGKD